MMTMNRQAWIEVTKEVLAGKTHDLKCPVCGNSTLDATWLPISTGGGEFRLLCRACGAENFVLKRSEGKSPEPQ